MAIFRRRSTPDPAAEAAEDESLEAASADIPDEEPAEEPDAVEGPWDESEQELADDLPRLDLGSLLIPGLPGIGVQVEADQNTQEVRAVTAVADDGNAAVQMQAFAAPKSGGLWDEIRAEMIREISATPGASATESEGAFGMEIRAKVPAQNPEGRRVTQPLRFAGVDGPRWFLRAVFLGKAAVRPDPDDQLHELVRQTVVVRGSEAMAPRDPLPLRLPEQPEGDPDDEIRDDDLEDDEDLAEDQPGKYADIDPFERGPEITEIR